jgi:hypothetical protein
MTKKHFIALADTLHDIRSRAENAATTGEVMRIVESELCRFCKSQNGQFDSNRFLDYSRGLCGPSGGTIRK